MAKVNEDQTQTGSFRNFVRSNHWLGTNLNITKTHKRIPKW